MYKLFSLTALFFFLVLFFTRLYNVEYTARFTEDESGFLVRAHQIFKEKKLTLVGQINEQGTKVFGSLTVYLLLPFAILGKFTPASVFYGAGFWGIVTAVTFLVLAKEINEKSKVLPALLILFWFPLVQMGRWAWNPNLIPFWIGLGLFFLFQKRSFFYFLGGLMLGLSVHHHYWAIFATGFFIFVVAVDRLVKREFKKAAIVILGFVFALLPFVFFDLKHPPGIFFLGASSQAQSLQIAEIPKNAVDYFFKTLQFYSQSESFAFAVSAGIILLGIFDLTKKSQAIFYFLPIPFQFLVIAAVGSYFPHYFFSILPFFFVWLIYPREKVGKLVANCLTLILVVGGLRLLPSLLFVSPVEPDLTTVAKIDEVITSEILTKSHKNVNIAVLGSPDHSTHGRKYRDLLLVPENINILTRDQYGITDNLFVVSTSQDKDLRSDPSYEMHNFINGPLAGKWEIPNSSWKVYLFNRNAK